MDFRNTFARIVLFLVYFWFGLLKVIGHSAANPLVESLLGKTLPFIPFATFIIILGVYEMLVGVFFLIPKLRKIAIALFALHMIAVLLPVVLLPDLAWTSFFVPTLEGQYIIKNLVLIALVLFV